MNELPGNLWNTPAEDYRVITTNLSVGFAGQAVMGRGLAYQASLRYPELRRRYGRLLQKDHNTRLAVFDDWHLICFPVKWKWHERADLGLIVQSAIALRDFCLDRPGLRVWMAQPGCGNGHRNWPDEVRPRIRGILPDAVTVLTWRIHG